MLSETSPKFPGYGLGSGRNGRTQSHKAANRLPQAFKIPFALAREAMEIKLGESDGNQSRRVARHDDLILNPGYNRLLRGRYVTAARAEDRT